MPIFTVQQKASIWYEVEVEADTAEAAILKVENWQMTDEEQDAWQQLSDSVEFESPTYWTEETGIVNANDLQTEKEQN